jgi:hypothetical protein
LRLIIRTFVVYEELAMLLKHFKGTV